MTLPRTAADVLSRHVVFEIESIDRLYLNVYVPELQRVGQVVGFLTRHLGFEIASTALVAKRSEAFVAGLQRYAADHGVPLIDFVKGQRKDDVMHEHLARCEGSEQVLFIGRAQEKARVFRTERRRNPTTGASYPWIVTATAMVNQFYIYAVDEDFGPFFLKFSSYFPYTARLCINGNEYAKRQATKAGIAFTALDNGFATIEDPADIPRVQAICDGLTEPVIDALLRKWLARLPHPFTPVDRAAGYRYQLSVLQAEFSLTQMLDKPVSGRIFFEQTIRENLDIGRPDQVSLIFNRQVRRNTPGVFRTRVITDTVTPSLHIDYKHCRIKQYHKEGKALRTETTINDTYDFAIGKRLTNLPALRKIGFSANRRLLGVQRLSHDPADGIEALAAITDPVTTTTGQRVPGMRFTDPRVQALLSALCVFRLLPRGFTNRDLRIHLAPQLGLPPEDMTSGQITYDLRRLRVHGLIQRIPTTHRYRVTDPGLRQALFLTRAHTRLLRTGLAEIHGPPVPTKLRAAARAYDNAINELARTAGLAA
ncbi:MAG TPA: hypothetical protein VGP04_07230 [Pseudonocardiaceae bacterium]|nr:hypothetical protein [Pseudonocardiaceae bacterium]